MRKSTHIIIILALTIILNFGIIKEIFAANTSVLSFASGSSVLSANGNVGSTTSSIFLTAGVASTTYTFYWDSTNAGHAVTLGTCTTGAGATTCSLLNFTIPHSSKSSWKIHDEASAVANSSVLTYTINSKIVNSTPISGNVGTSITVTGTGFASEVVSAKIGAVILGTATPTNGAGGTNGDFTVTSGVTAQPKGTYSISASGSISGNIPSAFTFVINPQISSSSSNGLSGATTQISGTGFAATSTVTVVQDSVNTSTSSATNSSGSFGPLTYTPTGSIGSHTINTKDASANTATNLTYTINGTLGISSSATSTLIAFTLTASPGTTTGNTNTITITDNRGTNVGWSTTISSSDFINGTHSIPVTNLTINPNNSTFNTISGSATGLSVGLSHTFISNVDTTSVLTASNGNGNGSYSINPGLSLSIPVGTFSGTYTATITETVQ